MYSLYTKSKSLYHDTLCHIKMSKFPIRYLSEPGMFEIPVAYLEQMYLHRNLCWRQLSKSPRKPNMRG